MESDARTALARSLGPGIVLGDELAGGAMARVYRARDTALERDIVVKVLAPELVGEVGVERFRREIVTAARLVHPQVVPVLAAGDADGMPWYSMPYVAGESLAQQLLDGAPMSRERAVDILRDVARALAAAHAQGIVHRDIKPGNVLLAGDAAVVTDFGLAKAIDVARAAGDARATHDPALTRAGMAMGTPAYMAPEQAAGDVVDARADVYAWGVMAYELLAARHPFAQHVSAQSLLTAHLTEAPPPLPASVPRAIADVVMRALAKSADARYADGAALLAAFDTALGGARSGDARPRARPVGPSKTLVRGAVVLAIVALGAEAMLYARGARRDGGDRAVAVARDSALQAPLLAVLPFTTIGTATDPGFAEGLAEAVTNKLARLGGLRVIDRASVVALGTKADDPRAIGTELGAQFVLRATVRWATGADGAARVQVTPVIVRTSDGTTRWSGDPIEASPTDPFAMQATMASQVADALDVAIAAVEREQLRRPSTRDAQAWALFERARQRATRAERLFRADPTELNAAFAELDSAIALDGDFLEAQALRARLLIAGAELGLRSPAARDSGFAVLRAVYARDPGTFPAAGMLAEEALAQGRIDEALRLVDGAIAARPSNGGLHVLRGSVAVARGDTTALRESLQRALALSPRDLRTLRGVGGRAIGSLRDSAFGNEVLRRAVRLAPDDPDVRAARFAAADATGDTLTMASEWAAYRAAGGPLTVQVMGRLRRGTAAMRREASGYTVATLGGRTALDTIVFHEERAALRETMGDLPGARADVDTVLAVEARLDTTKLFHRERVVDRYLRPRLLARAGRTAAARALLDSLRLPAWQRDTIRLDAIDRSLAMCARAEAFALLRDTTAMYAAVRDCLTRPSGRWGAWVRREPAFTPYLAERTMQRLLEETEPRVAPQPVRR